MSIEELSYKIATEPNPATVNSTERNNECEFKYKAFISYSHYDQSWGHWLHKSLETYRVPRRLIGTQSQTAIIPSRIGRVFIDREELPASPNLSSNIEEALKLSQYLIVICSPKSAVSHWVNEEILTFKRLGRANRVLACIVEGEPNASDGKLGFLPQAECFPLALRRNIDDAGKPSSSRAEPIAADVRQTGDGKRRAVLKLVAALLGLSFDDLNQREQQRRHRYMQLITGVAVTLATIFAALGASFVYQRDEAFRSQMETKQTLSVSDFLRADELVKSHQTRMALSHLARAVRVNPKNSAAARRILFLLYQQPCYSPDQITLDSSFNILDVSYKTDGHFNLLASKEGGVSVYDGMSQRRLFEPIPLNSEYGDARFFDDGSVFYTLEADGDAQTINPNSVRYHDSKTGVSCAKPASNHNFFVGRNGGGETCSSELLRAFTRSYDRIAIVFGDNNSDDNKIAIFETKTGRLLKVFSDLRDIKYITFSPAEDLLVVCGGAICDIEECFGQVELFDVSPSRPTGEWRRVCDLQFDNPVYRAAFSKDGAMLAVTCQDSLLHFLHINRENAKHGTIVCTVSATFHEKNRGIAFSPHSDELVVGAWRWHRVDRPLPFVPNSRLSCESICEYVGSTRPNAINEHPRDMNPYKHSVNVLKDTQTGHTISDLTPIAKLVQSQTRAVFRGPFVWYRTSGDILVTLADNRVRLWCASTGRSLTDDLVMPNDGGIGDPCFSPDNSYFVIACSGLRELEYGEGRAQFFDTITGRPLSDLIDLAALNPDSRHVMIDGMGSKLYISTSRGTYSLDIPGANDEVPPWLALLADSVGGYRLNEVGVLEELTPATRAQNLIRVRETLATNNSDDRWDLCGKWLLENRSSRSMSPYCHISENNFKALKPDVNQIFPFEIQLDNSLDVVLSSFERAALKRCIDKLITEPKTDNHVTSICITNCDIWVGSSNSGLSRIDRQSGHVTTFLDGTIGSFVMAIYMDGSKVVVDHKGASLGEGQHVTSDRGATWQQRFDS